MSKGYSRAKKARKRNPIEESAKRLAHSFGIPVDDRVREVAREMLDVADAWAPDMSSVWTTIMEDE